MIRLIIIILCISSHSVSYSQNGWFWQNPLPQGSTLNSVKFVNAQTGIAVGFFGSILRSTDAGETWSLYNSNFTNDIYSVAYSDVNNVFAVGSGGLIIKTTNSGLTWERLSIGNIGTNDTLKSVYFYDSNTGYITGSNGKIFKTTDSGNSWFEQNSGTNKKLNTAYFVNSENGFIGGNEILLRTTNSGNNWTALSLVTNVNSISFINVITGFQVGGTTSGTKDIRRTTNGGNTWITVFSPGTYTFNEIFFTNSSTGFIAGNENTLLKTTNGGVNWFSDNTISSQGFALNSVFFQNNGTGLLVGTYGTIFKSTDYGNFWTLKSPSGNLEAFATVDFTSENTGYATSKSIFKTTNGGNNWININSSLPNIFRIQFLNDNTGYVQQFPNLYKTQNGGITWSQINSSQDTLSGPVFTDANTGFCTKDPYGIDHYLYKTTNGGITWEEQSFYPKYVYFYNFPLQNLGYLILMDNLPGSTNLYKTTNSGDNWTFVSNVPLGTIDYTSKIFFYDENLGFLFNCCNNDSSQLFKTTNGGVDWKFNSNFIANPYRYSLKFVNINTAFIKSSYNYVFQTMNGGDNWVNFNVAGKQTFDIDYTNDITWYAVGEGGMIMKTTNGGAVGIENISSEIPSGFLLKQNYPNPFNPSTVIRYSLAENGFTTLKIYDLLGKTVSVLVNENQKTGSYSVDFNGFDLPSGIYFYKLSVNDFIETKKMVLLK